MTCDQWREKLDAYVDSAGSEEERASIEDHLRSCASCAADALGRLQMKRMTRAAAARFAPSLDFRQRVEKSVQPKRSSGWAFGWMPRVGALAVAVALLVAGLAMWIRHSERDQALAELIDLHVATLASANPVDVISTDRHTVKPWFQGKLPFTFNLPELQSSPFKLMGGSVAYFEHSPGAHLLFQVRSHEISVFIFQDQSGSNWQTRGVSAERELDFNAETWSEGGLRYFVVGDANSGDIHALGDLMRGAK